MIRKLVTGTTTALAAVALAACSTSTSTGPSASHPAALARSAATARAARLAALARPATCDHVYIPKWGVATCDAWARLTARERAVFSGPTKGAVIMSVTFDSPTTVTVDNCVRVVTSPGHWRIAWPGTAWAPLVSTGPVATGATSIKEATFSCTSV